MLLVLLVGGGPRRSFIRPLNVLEPWLQGYVRDLPIVADCKASVQLTLRFLEVIALSDSLPLLRFVLCEFGLLILGEKPHLRLAHLHVRDSLV